MSYEEALKAAGADVHAFESFGSYQGDWWAKVTYKGETGWVNGCFGSCSGCDAFKAEFDYDEGSCEEHKYESPESECKECIDGKKKYQERLAEFGRSYLDELVMTQDQAEKEAGRNIEWDSDAKEMVDWLKANAV